MSKILIISGSPRIGNVSHVCTQLLKDLKDRVEDDAALIELAELNVGYCNGCLKCEDEGVCPVRDDMPKIQKAMTDADIILLGSPVYFDNVPGVLKSLLDRSNLFMSELKGKKCAFFLCGQADEASWENCANILKNYLDICGIEFLGSIATKARVVDDIDADEAKTLSAKIIAMLR